MLVATGLTKSYRQRQVLDAVSLRLADGECLGIAGHNGSGKSTLLSLIAQTQRPSAGRIQHNGTDVLGNRRFMREMVGYVPQANALLDDLTVEETLRFWQKTYGVDTPLFAPGAPASEMGLQPLRNKKVATLSGGMQKRLSIALALLHSPRYLLLDEALAALDRRYRQALARQMRDIQARGGGILYCSHSIDELLTLCDNILVLQDGKQIFYGAPATLPTGADALDAMLNSTVSLGVST